MAEFAMKEKKEGKSTSSVLQRKNRFDRQVNLTGIPAQLKERLEESTGLSLDDVRVHYNSDLPARLDALAYTQGNRVEIGPGQERHLPHELGHVVQQKLGTVRANAMHASGVALNTDTRLERQADEIGAGKRVDIVQRMGDNVVQRSGKGTAVNPAARASGVSGRQTQRASGATRAVTAVPDTEKILYHGTLEEYALSIYNNGVELGHGRNNMDFGKGFYTTELRDQASEWARKLVGIARRKIHGAIVEFNVPEREFNRLNNLSFPEANERWAQLVTDGRNARLQDNHDTISGPLLLNPGEVMYRRRVNPRSLQSGGQQTAFNTQAAVDVLNRHRKGVITL